MKKEGLRSLSSRLPVIFVKGKRSAVYWPSSPAKIATRLLPKNAREKEALSLRANGSRSLKGLDLKILYKDL